MAHHGYMTIKGTRQGLISAGCCAQDSIGGRSQIDHLDEIMMLSFQHDVSNPDNTRPPVHRPVIITKHIDKATPLLAGALDNREILECKILFFRTSAAGKHEPYFRILLHGAMVVEQRLDMPDSLLMNEQQPLEYLAIRYRDIGWQHLSANTSAYAIWGQLE
jgi:hypothetical protein